MHSFSNALQSTIKSEIDAVNQVSDNAIQKSEGCIALLKRNLGQLNHFILDYTFKDQQEEIWFFKEFKPDLHAQLLYYREVLYLERRRPEGSRKAIRKYLNKQLNRVQMFFEKNNGVFYYYKSGKTDHDERYFVRNENPVLLDPEFSIDIDTRLTTSHSNCLAHIKAFERLRGYIMHLINQLEKVAVAHADQPKSNLVFTDPKVGVVELGYSLFAKGAFNNGNASLRQIMEVIQFAFNVDLGNYNAMYNQNIRLRKRLERSAYLMALIKYNDGRMDDLDNNPR